jgi:hypothetical protein
MLIIVIQIERKLKIEKTRQYLSNDRKSTYTLSTHAIQCLATLNHFYIRSLLTS